MSQNDLNSPAKPNFANRMLRGLTREIIVPVSMALVVIFFVIQAFKIPSGSMEDTLLVGDFLLGLKFVYGSPIPFSEKRLPGLQSPEPGDIIIFRYPGDPETPEYDPNRFTHLANLLMFGNLYWDKTPSESEHHLVHYPLGPRDFIKRCIAKSGQVIQVKNGILHIDGKPHVVPGMGKYMAQFREPTPRDFFGPLRVPFKGDTLKLDQLPIVQLWFARSLMMQENPHEQVLLDVQLIGPKGPETDFDFEHFRAPIMQHKGLLINELISQVSSDERHSLHLGDTIEGRMSFAFFRDHARTGFISQAFQPGALIRTVGYDAFDPTQLEDLERNVQALGNGYHLQYTVLENGKPIHQYVVQQPVFFMMGDNRDNSADSRFWGFVSFRNIKAKAAIVYFSFDNADDVFSFTNPVSWVTIPFKIRWLRFGKLIQDIGRPWE